MVGSSCVAHPSMITTRHELKHPVIKVLPTTDRKTSCNFSPKQEQTSGQRQNLVTARSNSESDLSPQFRVKGREEPVTIRNPCKSRFW